ncbi:MAG: LysR family transcriptional regulator [Gammaproteobacteria bacterium]
MKKLRQYDLNLLVALDALLTERNVTRAGERLHVSQPAMSGMLSRLRQIFDDELLVRVGRHLEPTDLAATLAEPLHECVQQIDDLMNLHRPFEQATENRSFTVVASDYVAMLILGPLVRRLTDLAPNLAARFVAFELPIVADRLAAGTIDFAIVPSGVAPGFPSIPLFTDSWTCAVWAEHPTVGDQLTIDEFAALPHLTFNASDPESNTLAEDHFSQMGYESRIVASTLSFATAVFSLRGTSLVTTIPRRLGERLLEPAQIRLVELPFEAPPLQEELVWNPRFTASAAHAWFREQLTVVAGLL